LSSDDFDVRRDLLTLFLSVLNAFIDLPSGNDLTGSDLFAAADLEDTLSVHNNASFAFAF